MTATIYKATNTACPGYDYVVRYEHEGMRLPAFAYYTTMAEALWRARALFEARRNDVHGDHREGHP